MLPLNERMLLAMMHLIGRTWTSCLASELFNEHKRISGLFCLAVL